MNSKKSQSQVITTILLILITISLVIIISSFAISFVREKLSESDCTDNIGKVEIRNNPKYTCYNEAIDKLNVQVHIGDIDDVHGFVISIDSQGSSESYEITEGATLTDVTMFDTTVILSIPQKNAEKTYTISRIINKPETINIYPILKEGKVCGSSDIYKFIADCPPIPAL